ncbi:unnamed protein product [Trifolium pratense]|uniref:Uncharacterized protein n=1 Tax=Trifolium pratense TaxID=57577 RepID=A0ACB0L7C0_TRIPR|nr:unnamed protein product [Trifolium pratense]
MALFGSITIVCALFFFLCIIFQIHRRRFCRYPTMIDYPFLGMLPPLLWNLWHIHDFLTEELKKQHRSTGEFMGPWFTRMNYLVTSDPINVHHIMSKCFANYVKGQEFHEIFEAFGDGIFNADSETWKYNRSLFHSIFKQRDFELFQEKIIRNKLERSLIPILDHVQQKASVVDLQDVFNRFTFDNICSVVLGCDPNCLSIDFPDVACEKAFDQIEECIFYRHAIPKGVWILQKFLQVGQEKKMTKASKEFDEFIYASIESKREELRKGINNDEMGDLLTAFMKKEKESQVIVHDDKFLRDAAFNLFVAGRDTITSALTWLFYLVATHPLVETKILEEIKEKFGSINNIEKKIGVDDVKKLVYLQGAICEAIRLFPPIPFERKQAIEGDILPSGHVVNPNTIILFSLYSMGRLEETWGKDCLEFKPERWISERGSIVHNPSYKFFGFNAGPRTCLGKDLSFIQIKMIAIAILCKYRVLLVEDHVPLLSHSIVLLMKNGFKVRITKREI